MTRVLIVDDEPMVLEMYGTMIEAGGHEVIGKATNGSEAVSAFHAVSPPPEVVLMDYRMPGTNGLDATRQILKTNPEAQVVIVSADATIGPECAPAGAVGYLEKPVAMSVLWDTVQRLGARGGITVDP